MIFSTDRPLIMGILNVTPDSFSDGGLHEGRVAERVLEIVADGADIIDIGGESTRPGAELVSIEEEWSRVALAIEAACDAGAIVSIDTRKAEIARRALDAGARFFNDVSALTFDTQSTKVAARFAEAGGSVCLMHASTTDPKTMQAHTEYTNVVVDVMGYLSERIVECERAGIRRGALIVDPGIGFGKTVEQNLELLRRLKEFQRLGCPVLVGASRKGFIGKLSGEADALKRMPGSVAVALHAATQGAKIIRVHDVRETAQAFALWRAIESETETEQS